MPKEKMNEFDKILFDATANIDDIYFHFRIEGNDVPIFRERVYCYELYHQMRKLWPRKSDYHLNGEVDKAAHPILRELDADSSKPDLLVHKPGYMEGNYAIIEVKHYPARKKDIIKDLKTLKKFIKRVKYQRGIYLFYGDELPECVRNRVMKISNENTIDMTKIELLYHHEITKPAIKL